MNTPIRLRPGIAALAVALCLGGVWHLAGRAAETGLAQDRQISAQSRVMALMAELDKQRAVTAILSDDALILQGLQRPTPELTAAMSRKLDRLRAESGGAVIYVLDRAGKAIAASNWDEPESFVGADYSFRDYFRAALRDGTATQFALGTVSHRPGLYLSHSVVLAGQPVGVVVVKVEFPAIEASWAREGEATHVIDAQGQILLTSEPDRRFDRMAPSGTNVLESSAPLPGIDWRLVIQSPLTPVRQIAALATATAALILMLVALSARALRRRRRRAAMQAEAERRYRADLEQAVTERTRALSAEMQERAAAEARLRSLQADLVQANKLAALGQITAGVAHEINQPLATIRLLAENGKALMADHPQETAANLDTILRMTDRIGHITADLRSFARKSRGTTMAVALKDPFEASVLLTASRLRPHGVQLTLPDIPADLRVMGEGVRLEQVLVNLLQNAHEAVADQPQAEIRVSLATDATTATLTIADNGPGLPTEVAAALFTPFQTTKPGGLGLGLVIAHDIARDFGARLWADPPVAGRGATFHLQLCKAPA